MPLGDLKCHTLWDDAKEIPNLLVRVNGRQMSPVRVPLNVQMKGGRAAPTLVDAESLAPFNEYLSRQLGDRVTGVYYNVRQGDKNGRQTVQRVKFDGQTNPFVGGMEILVSLNGNEPDFNERL